MKKRSRKYIILFLGLVFFLLIFFCVLCFSFDIKINSTKSAPLGVYKIVSSSKWQKGDYVYFCPLDNKIFAIAWERHYISSGFCSSGYGFLLKKIAALKGDVISINEEGVFVNGKFQAHSKPLLYDIENRPMPKVTFKDYRLSDHEVLLLSKDSDASFDGRYFGLINKAFLVAKVKPLFVW